MKRFRFIVVVVGILFVLAACTSNAPITGRQQVKFVDDKKVYEESKKTYNSFIGEAKRNGLLLNNTKDSKRLKSIGKRISNSVENFLHSNGMSEKINYLHWEFNLIKSNEVNAFAMPGGKIVFNTALMKLANNDAEIAAVMGHEIGHVIAGHHAEDQSNQITAGLVLVGKEVLDYITSGATSIVSNDIVSAGLNLTLLSFSRTQEYEADKYGMIFMAMAGYNPYSAITFWEKMSAAKSQGSTFEILSTHPNDSNRIQELKAFLPEALKYYKK